MTVFLAIRDTDIFDISGAQLVFAVCSLKMESLKIASKSKPFQSSCLKRATLCALRTGCLEITGNKKSLFVYRTFGGFQSVRCPLRLPCFAPCLQLRWKAAALTASRRQWGISPVTLRWDGRAVAGTHTDSLSDARSTEVPADQWTQLSQLVVLDIWGAHGSADHL